MKVPARWVTALPLLVLAFGFPSVVSAGTEQPDPKQVELLYSADDALCDPLAAVYDKLNHEHGPGTHLVLDWERQFAGRFAAIGLHMPSQIIGLPTPWRRGGPAFYYSLDLLGDGLKRLVYVDDECVGRCDEDSTVIWVFKPGKSVTLHDYQEPWPGGVQTEALFDPATIESELAFYLNRVQTAETRRKYYPAFDYPMIYARFIDEIASEHDKSLSPRERFQRFDPAIAGGMSPFIQQVWLLQGKAVFTARDFPASVLVYRYVGPNTIADVCYLEGRGTLDWRRHWQDAHKSD